MATRKTKKRRVNRNPKVRKYAKRAASRARGALSGLSFKTAFKNAVYFQAGMFGAKWLAKRFGGGASETDPSSWGWKEYAKGGAGAVAAAFIMNMVKPGSGQKVLEGGLNLMIYEMIQNELISGNEWATGQFGWGADEAEYYPGDVAQDDAGTSYLLGEDYQWHQLPESSMTGSLEPVGPLGALEPVGPLGGEDVYAKAFLES